MPLPLPRSQKDPQATLDYVVDWSAWLEPSSNDILVSVNWIVPVGLTKSSQTNDSTTATIWLSGGALNRVYTVTCRVTTLNNRIQDYSFQLFVQDR